MKTPTTVLADIERRLQNRSHLDVTGDNGWPHRFPLQRPSNTELATNFPTVQKAVFTWLDWAKTHHLTLDQEPRRANGSIHNIPTHLLIPDIDTAATLLGNGWPARLTTGRHRHQLLTQQFPHADHATIIKKSTHLTPVDFDLLLTAATWFTHHDATGLTTRQVPIEGLHAKWLDTNLGLVRTLSGKEDLGLINRPTRIPFTYLDPHHRAAGHRHHDTATVGDPMAPAYQPATVIITENKDTALYFPPLPHAISVEGGGYGGAPGIATIDWITNATHILYWGDIDADGLRIVNQFRSHGLNIQTLLMDQNTYTTYEKYGTHTDKHGKDLDCKPRLELPHLTNTERALYLHLTDPTHHQVRRIEQERIPLDAAWATVHAAIAVSA